jgi:HEAT repeat protein
LHALGQIARSEGLPALQDAVRSDSVVRRSAAIQGLAAHGGHESVALLEWVAAADADPAVSRAAVEALVTIAAGAADGARSAVDALLALLSDPTHRDGAATCLARLPASRIGDVARGLRHPHPAVRSGAIDALGRFQREEATRPILDALSDASPLVREAAVLTLARVGARGIEPTLGEIAARDASKTVRRAAATALARIRM